LHGRHQPFAAKYNTGISEWMLHLKGVPETPKDIIKGALQGEKMGIAKLTLGELFLSPVGLSLVSRIAPVKLASLLMGVWLASSGVANILAGQLAVFTQSLGYFEVFALIGGMAIFFGLVLLSISKKLVSMMEIK